MPQRITHRITRRLLCLCLTALTAFLSPAHAATPIITYYHLDALGSPLAATDAQGNLLWKETYTAYGDRQQNAIAANTNTRWYTGHPDDSEVGLSYFGARWYDPSIGRFMGVDPQPFSEQDPHSFNRYVYGNNNPYKYIDPNGQWVVAAILWAAGVGVAIYEMSKPVPLDAYHDSAIESIPTFPGPVGEVGMGVKVGASVGKGLERAANTAGREIGILRDAASGKGNFGLGKATAAEADKVGRAWVGEGYRIASDGKTLVSEDGLKVYRPPSPKSSPYAKTGVQANLERKIEAGGRPISNGHLDIE